MKVFILNLEKSFSDKWRAIKNILLFFEISSAEFQAVPPVRDTATKLLTNFLRIPAKNPFGRRKRQTRIEDIVVVMDGSGSVSRCEFGKGKKALKHMMEMAEDDSTANTKYAAVTFSSSATRNFKFLPYSTAANKIMQISYPGMGTNTQAGLAEAKKLFEDTSSGQYLRIVLLVGVNKNKMQPNTNRPYGVSVVVT